MSPPRYASEPQEIKDARLAPAGAAHLRENQPELMSGPRPPRG